MQQSMIRFLQISFILLLFSSCVTSRYPNSLGKTQIEKKLVNDYFTDTSAVVSYRTSIEFAKQQISGTLIIRTYSNDLHRIALLSDMGQTIFDLSIFNEYYVVNVMLPAMDKKIVTNELANVFRVMLQPYHAQDIIQVAGNVDLLYEVRTKNKRNYYRYENSQLTQIEQFGNRNARFSIKFDSSNKYPDGISLLHNRFPLKISLTLQNENL